MSKPNAIGYAKFYSCSHDAVIRVYDEAGYVIATHEHTGEFKEPQNDGEGVSLAKATNFSKTVVARRISFAKGTDWRIAIKP